MWPGDGPPTIIAPAFVGYDYSFAPNGLTSPDNAIEGMVLILPGAVLPAPSTDHIWP